MNCLQPSSDWEVLLNPFQFLFTKAVFRYVRVFGIVFAPLDGRLWVAAQWEGRPVVFLFCTDILLTAEALVAAYGSRFAVETGFWDAKQSFGFSTYQVRREERFVALAHLCLWAQTRLRLDCCNQTPAPIYGGWRKSFAYLTLSQQKRVSASHRSIFGGSLEPLPTAANRQIQALATCIGPAVRPPNTLNYRHEGKRG